MKPYKVNLFVYADNDEDVKQLEKALYDFVREKYNNGVLVTANTVAKAINNFKNNPILSAYLRNGSNK